MLQPTLTCGGKEFFLPGDADVEGAEWLRWLNVGVGGVVSKIIIVYLAD